jgi:hypothetical protein
MPLETRPAARLAALAGLLTLLSCAPPAPVVVAPAEDPQGLAQGLLQATGLRTPILVRFGWQLNEAGVRVRGRGVARIEPPYKARLDLFLGNGETVMRAALVDGDLRLPPGAPENFLPPPDLMWGVLGVFRPEPDTRLLGADELQGGDLRLRYRYPDDRELHFRVAKQRVRSLEMVEEGHVVQRVELGLEGENRYPAEATYRDLAAYRELKLTRETVQQVGPFPPGIFDPMPGATR